MKINLFYRKMKTKYLTYGFTVHIFLHIDNFRQIRLITEVTYRHFRIHGSMYPDSFVVC
jgi:hypothetical protein